MRAGERQVARARCRSCPRRPERAGKGSWWCRAGWSSSRHSSPRRRRKGWNRVRDRPQRFLTPVVESGPKSNRPPRSPASTPSIRTLLSSESPPRTNSEACAPRWPVLDHKRTGHESQRTDEIVAKREIERAEHAWSRHWFAAAAWACRLQSPRSTRAPSPAQARCCARWSRTGRRRSRASAVGENSWPRPPGKSGRVSAGE